ncbi:MAG: hypothetical protein ACRCXT_23965 [Paraclostridium sp.]
MIYYIVEKCGWGVADMGTTKEEFENYIKEKNTSKFNVSFLSGIFKKTDFFNKEEVERLATLLNRCIKKEKYLVESC